MNKKLLGMVVVLMLPMLMFAERRTPESVLEIARKSNQSINNASMRKMVKAAPPASGNMTVNKSGGETDGLTIAAESKGYFAVNTESGFVLVSSDDRMPQVLGYSENGHFDPENIPDAMRDILAMYDDESEMLPEPSDGGYLEFPTITFDDEVGPLIETRWGQREPYYNFTPASKNVAHCVTGCTATAMAQILKYYNYPTKGKGAHSYDWVSKDDSSIKKTLSVNFGATTYDWDNMLNSYNGVSYNQTQADAVATLIYHCGVAVEMSYGANGSGGSTKLAAQAFASYFDYDDNIVIIPKDYYTIDSLCKIAHKELKARRPILMQGYKENNSGHTFVCDGYNSSGYFHFNWGWNGSSDGYYLLSALNPNSSGNADGYNQKMWFFVGVQPNKENPPYSAPQLRADSIYVSKEKVKCDEPFPVKAYYVENQKVKTIKKNSVSLTYALMDRSKDEVVEVLDESRKLSSDYDLQFDYHFYTLSLNVNIPSSVDEGVYRLRLLYKDEGCDWIPMNCVAADDYLTVYVRGDSAFFYDNSELDKEYTITTSATNAIVSKGGTYEFGSKVVLSASPYKKHHFVRWSDGDTNPTRTVVVLGDKNYHAICEPNVYDVSFYDADGTLLDSIDYVYGTPKPTAPEVPDNSCHPFKSWNSDFTNILSDTSFYILRDTLRYNVTFYDYDSTTVLQESQLVECGMAADSPADPERVGYTFERWSTDYDNITEETSVYAVYTPNTYSVSFYDYDNTLIGTTIYVYDTELEVPDVPDAPCHPFKSWNSDFTNILSDTSFYILRDTLRYNVTFYDYDSTTVLQESQLVECGTSADSPADPERVGYTFEGWSADYDNITEETSVYAVYTPNTYNVAFYDVDGTLVGSVAYLYDTPTPTAPEAPDNSCHPFKSWNSDFSNILSDTSFYILRDTLRYNVTFYDYDSTTVLQESQLVECGTSADSPADPERVGYTFEGWSADYDNITEETSVYAVYTPNTYNVAFYDVDGTLVGSVAYLYDTPTPTAPEAPDNSCHPFKSWNSDFSNILSDTSFYILRDTLRYNVTFYDCDSTTVLQESQLVECGTAAVPPTDPARVGYTFERWSDAYDNITEATSVYAVYTPNTYSVLFYDYDNTLIGTTIYVYDTELEVPDVPSNPCHPFKAWNSDFKNILGDTSFFIVRDTLRYTVEFLTYDSTVIRTELVECGKSATPPTLSEREGYTFTGWSDGYEDIIQDVQLIATYEINTYSLTLSCEKGNVSGAGAYDYGTDVVLEVTPIECCHFVRWSDGNTENPRSLTIYADSALKAICEYDQYTLSITYDSAKGSVSGEGIYNCGTEVSVTASPKEGYYFSHWVEREDGDSFSMTISEDVTLQAVFDSIAEFPDSISVLSVTDTSVAFVWKRNPYVESYQLIYWSGEEDTLSWQGVNNQDLNEQNGYLIEDDLVYLTIEGLQSNSVYNYLWRSCPFAEYYNYPRNYMNQLDGQFQTQQGGAVVYVDLINPDYQVVYEKDGRIFGPENMRIFSVFGIDVTCENGDLRGGVYLVNFGEQTRKIVVK